MPPTPSSPLPPLFLLLLLTFLLRNLPTFTPKHDEPFTLTFRTPTATFHTATSRNPFQSRCVLLHCSTAPPPLTKCDYLQLTQFNTTRSPRLCVLDYLAANWDSLSRTYNDGVFHVSSTLHLQHPPHHLPTHSKKLHVPFARLPPDISPVWFALIPSNTTRKLIREWAAAANKLPAKSQAPEQTALNRIRDCRSPDIMCHPRSASIKLSCDGLDYAQQCAMRDPNAPWLRAFLKAVTLMAALRMSVQALERILARKRLKTITVWTALDVSVPVKVAVVAVASGFAMIMLLLMLKWSTMLQVLGRLIVVKVVRRLDVARVDGRAFGGELRGAWDKYAFILADGAERVVVSGPGAGFVVWLFEIVRWVQVAVEDGLLLWCFVALILVRAAMEAIAIVAGVRGKKRVVEEEYADSREYAMYRRREKGRSFVLAKERGRIPPS
eukprot:GFKZ01009930.1.p1 GENE.GFKZ01009930.1~~GFKZ01009930.1.p1  ORF type:complete len:455 (-),score=56.41 GFKZ01009930.1:976-2292(-)